MATPINKKKKFVKDGVFRAELNRFLTNELAEDGYSGVQVRHTPARTEIIILATRTQNVLGEKGRRIRELTSLVQKRFNFPEGTVELYAEKVATRGLCAIAQAESLRYKLIGGLAVRRACYGVLRFIMESGAKGCEVVVSGKLRGQRAKAMKFVDGLMIHSGDPVNDYVDMACRRPAQTGCAWYQGQDHVALGSCRQDWSQEAPPRPRVYCGAKGGDSPTKPILRDQGRQARPSPCGLAVLLKSIWPEDVINAVSLPDKKK